MNAVQVAERALAIAQAGDAKAAWRELAPAADQLGIVREVALAFSELLRLDPTYPDALLAAEKALGAFRTDPGIVIPLPTPFSPGEH